MSAVGRRLTRQSGKSMGEKLSEMVVPGARREKSRSPSRGVVGLGARFDQVVPSDYDESSGKV